MNAAFEMARYNLGLTDRSGVGEDPPAEDPTPKKPVPWGLILLLAAGAGGAVFVAETSRKAKERTAREAWDKAWANR